MRGGGAFAESAETRSARGGKSICAESGISQASRGGDRSIEESKPVQAVGSKPGDGGGAADRGTVRLEPSAATSRCDACGAGRHACGNAGERESGGRGVDRSAHGEAVVPGKAPLHFQSA